VRAALAGIQRLPASFVLVLGTLTACLTWSCWPTLCELANIWQRDPKYTHGYLVPLFAAVLLWMRRHRLSGVRLQWSWWGVLVIAGGTTLSVSGGYFFVDACSAAGLVVTIAGLVVLAGGWPLFRWAWPACAFLLFMLPLPYRLEVALAQPLQRLATRASTYALQTIGIPALAEGNVIVLPDARIGVVEACSGLSMMMLFFALSTAVVLVVRRAWWEKLVILLSAVPIAIIANVVRISATCVLHETVGSAVADAVYHELAGWLMMPLALGLLLLELHLMSRLWITVEANDPAPLELGPGGLSSPGLPEVHPRHRRKGGKQRARQCRDLQQERS
jgi:exosortase